MREIFFLSFIRFGICLYEIRCAFHSLVSYFLQSFYMSLDLFCFVDNHKNGKQNAWNSVACSVCLGAVCSPC